MKILITGASGFVGSHLGVQLSKLHEIIGITHQSKKVLPFPVRTFDLRLSEQLSEFVKFMKPQVIVHSAALSRVLDCEQNSDAATKLNVDVTCRLALVSEKISAKLIFLSSDQVFDGKKGLYCESDKANPINHYGKTKLAAEEAVLEANGRNLVVRSNSVVGRSIGWGESFSEWIRNSFLNSEDQINLFDDQYRSPIHIRSIVDTLHAACEQEISGLLHVGGLERLNRVDIGYTLCRLHGFDPDRINRLSYTSHPQSSIMPRDGSYNISRLKQVLPSLQLNTLEEEFAKDAELLTSHEA